IIVVLLLCFFFFFSSRRRHTRWPRDWSSDVCSSDLKLRRKRRYLKVLKPLEVSEGDRRIGIYPAEEFRVRCYVDFPHPLVGQQEVEMIVGRDTFRHLLARARTFCFDRDIKPLRAMGLIRGGSLENAIVLTRDGIMNGPLRFPDEFGRHKALDLI